MKYLLYNLGDGEDYQVVTHDAERLYKEIKRIGTFTIDTFGTPKLIRPKNFKLVIDVNLGIKKKRGGK